MMGSAEGMRPPARIAWIAMVFCGSCFGYAPASIRGPRPAQEKPPAKLIIEERTRITSGRHGGQLESHSFTICDEEGHELSAESLRQNYRAVVGQDDVGAYYTRNHRNRVFIWGAVSVALVSADLALGLTGGLKRADALNAGALGATGLALIFWGLEAAQDPAREALLSRDQAEILAAHYNAQALPRRGITALPLWIYRRF
jgi:hypothetical protein